MLFRSQGGYFITEDVELYSRWEWLSTQNQGYNDINTPTGAGVGTANVFNAGRPTWPRWAATGT